jgi:hypothetical protein
MKMLVTAGFNRTGPRAVLIAVSVISFVSMALPAFRTKYHFNSTYTVVRLVLRFQNKMVFGIQ